MPYLARLVGVTALALGAIGFSAGAAAAAPLSHASVAHCSNCAGYSGTTTNGITTFTGRLNVPEVTCPATGSIDMSALIEGYDAAGDAFEFTWYVACISGTASYYDGASASPSTGPGSAVSTPVAPGDSLEFLMEEGTTYVSATIIDTTNGAGGTATAAMTPSFDDFIAETIFFSSSGTLSPIPSFTPINYSALKINGASISTLGLSKWAMYDGTIKQVATSAISSGGSFTNTFKHV